MDNEESGLPTIGVAIAVPEPWSTALAGVRLRAGDPAATQVPVHVTLLCPLQVPDDPRIDRHLAAVAARTAPFELCLRGAGTFRPVTPVVYAAVAAGGPECVRLAARIRTGPLAKELRFPYHPHVTVAQQVPEPALDRASAEIAGFSARFRVDRFLRYRRGPDGRWRPGREFPLLGRRATIPRPRGATGAVRRARV